MELEERRALGHRLREARDRMGLERPELAERLGVHAGSIARWETGGSTPVAYHLERIAEWAGVDPAWLREGRRAQPAPAAPAGDPFDAPDATRAFLAALGPAGQERLRKHDALDGLRRMLSTRGALPGWWYALREEVEAGGL